MDSDEGKIFVGGLSWNTEEDLLGEHFSKYGEVLKVTVVRKKVTGRSRRFGFVVFSDPAVIDMVLQDKHQIDHREVDVKRKTPREEQNPAGNFDSGVRTKKIFMEDLPFSLTLEEFRAYFETYGRMSDAVITIDLTTQPPRVYGSVSFYLEDSADRVLQKSFHDLKGNPVKVLRSLPEDANPGVASGSGGDGAASGGDGAGATSGGGGGGAGAASGGDEAGAASAGGGDGAASGGDGAGAASCGGGAGAASGGGEAGAASASGGGGAGAFPGYGGSSGSGYEGHMDSNRYMQLQNTGSGDYPPYGASGYGHGGFGWYGYPTYGASGYSYGSYAVDYGGFVGYGYPARVPYGGQGTLGDGPRSSWGAQVPSGYGNVEYENAAPCIVGPGSAVIEQIGGSGGNGNHQANNGQDVMVEVMEKMLWWKFSSGLMVDVMVGYGGVGGYGYPAGAPYGNPAVPGASDPSSSWGSQVSSNIHNTHGSGSGYEDASNGSGGYGNHQRNNWQAGYGGSCGKGKQVQQ